MVDSCRLNKLLQQPETDWNLSVILFALLEEEEEEEEDL